MLLHLFEAIGSLPTSTQGRMDLVFYHLLELLTVFQTPTTQRINCLGFNALWIVFIWRTFCNQHHAWEEGGLATLYLAIEFLLNFNAHLHATQGIMLGKVVEFGPYTSQMHLLINVSNCLFQTPSTMQDIGFMPGRIRVEGELASSLPITIAWKVSAVPQNHVKGEIGILHLLIALLGSLMLPLSNMVATYICWSCYAFSTWCREEVLDFNATHTIGKNWHYGCQLHLLTFQQHILLLPMHLLLISFAEISIAISTTHKGETWVYVVEFGLHFPIAIFLKFLMAL